MVMQKKNVIRNSLFNRCLNEQQALIYYATYFSDK